MEKRQEQIADCERDIKRLHDKSLVYGKLSEKDSMRLKLFDKNLLDLLFQEW